MTEIISGKPRQTTYPARHVSFNLDFLDETDARSVSGFVSGLENSDELLDMISAAQEQREVRSKKAEVFYSEHYTVSKMMTGVKAGTLHQGIFNVSPYNYLEGSVHVPAFDKSLLILGRE